MARDIHELIREIDGVTAVNWLRKSGRMLFKDQNTLQLLTAYPPSSDLLEALRQLEPDQKREPLSASRSIWLAREILYALASNPRLSSIIIEAWNSLQQDELVSEARIPRGLVTDLVSMLASAAQEADGA